MPAPRLLRSELSLLLLVLLGGGCGLVDGEGDVRSAASWCEEEGLGEIAEVELLRVRLGDGFTDLTVTLRDADDRTLANVQMPTDLAPGRRAEYVLDPAGNVIETTVDWDPAGTIDEITTSTYDEQGRVLRTSVDEDNDGVIDLIDTWDYSNPLQEQHFSDRNTDGMPDSVETITYAESGEILLEEDDVDADGEADWTRTHTWSDDGLLVEVATVEHRAFWSVITSYSYDERGRLARTLETVEDREYDSSQEIVYEYDDSDRLIRMIRTDLLDPSTMEKHYEYNDSGQLTTVSTNWGTDADPEQIERLTYDDDGRILREEERDQTGALRSAEAYDYGLDADPIRRSQDFNGDGAWDLVTTWTACE